MLGRATLRGPLEDYLDALRPRLARTAGLAMKQHGLNRRYSWLQMKPLQPQSKPTTRKR
jgi:hypothetical protein